MNTKPYMKIIALCICVLFTWTTIAFSAPPVYSIKVDEETGSIPQRFKGSDQKTIIHIQDAHTSFEAQKNLARIICDLIPELRRSSRNAGETAPAQWAPFVGIEGAVGAYDLKELRDFPLKKPKETVSAQYVKEGKFIGAEHASVISDNDFTLFGLEDESLLKKDFNAFYGVSQKMPELEAAIEELEEHLTLLKDAYFNDALSGFDKAASSFEDDASHSIDFFSTLYRAADENGIDLLEYVHLLRFKEVFLLDSRIDDAELDREIGALAEELRQIDEIKESVVAVYERYRTRAIEQKEILDYLLVHAAKYSIPTQAYANVKYAKQYWCAYTTLDMNHVLYEAIQVSYAIRRALATGEDALTIISFERRLNILKRVLALKAVREDISEFRRDRPRYSFSALSADLGQFGIQRGTAIAALDLLLHQAEEFYQYADERDHVMIENAIKEMDHKDQDVGIVVAGGYHSEGITEILKQKDISYVTIRPHITSVTEDVAYMDRMLGHIFSVDAFLRSMLQTSRINMATRTLNEQGYARLLEEAGYEMHGTMLIDPETHKPLSFADLQSLISVLHNSGDPDLIELAQALERIISDEDVLSELARTHTDKASLRHTLRDAGISLKGSILLEQFVAGLQSVLDEPAPVNIDRLHERTPLDVFVDLIRQPSLSEDGWAKIAGIIVKKGPQAVLPLLRVFVNTDSPVVAERLRQVLERLGPVLPDDINTIVGILADRSVDIEKRAAVAHIFERLLDQASITLMQECTHGLRGLIADEDLEASIKYHASQIIRAMNARATDFYEKSLRIENAEKTVKKHSAGFLSTISDSEIADFKPGEPFFVYADAQSGLLEGYPSSPDEQGRNVIKTPIQVLVEDFGFDPLEDIIRRARMDPARTITIVDWGVGYGTGWLNEVAYGLEQNGITNVRLIGFGNMYFPEWQRAHPRIEFILDTAENFHEYFTAGQIDLIVSHIGLFHLESIAYNAFFQSVHPLLNDDAQVVHDYPAFRQSHIIPELEGLGYAIVKDDAINWQSHCTVVEKRSSDTHKERVSQGSPAPAVTPGDDVIQEKVFGSPEEVLAELPGQIISRLGRLGLSDQDLTYAKEIMETVREIYAAMDDDGTLIHDNYHNFMHNVMVTNAMLVMTERLAAEGALSDTRRDVKVAFLGAFFHDFHVRAVHTDAGVGTPANVAETLNQLKDLFGLEDYTGPVERVAATARYAALDDALKQKLQDAIHGLLSLHSYGDATDREEIARVFYEEMSVLILRTDFASDIPVPPTYKPATIKIREELNEVIQGQITDGGTIGVDLVRLGVSSEYDGLLARAEATGDTDAVAGINRQRGIETAYLNGLGAVPLSRRAVLHTLAVRLEKGGDQSGSTWMAAPELFDEIIRGLGKEIPGISPEGNFLFFESELLRADVLEILRFLPEEFKNNFLKNVERAVENGKRLSEVLADDVPIKGILAGAPERWNDSKQNILYVLGMSKNLLYGSRLHQVLRPQEFESLVNAIEIERFDADETIIVEGASVADGGRFYEVISGQAQIFKDGTQIATVGPGEVLGEIALVSQESTRTATVVMSAGSIVASIKPDIFNEIYTNNETFKTYIDSTVQKRTIENERQAEPNAARSATKGWFTTLSMVGIFAVASLLFAGADKTQAYSREEGAGVDRPARVEQGSIGSSQQKYFGIIVDAPRHIHAEIATYRTREEFDRYLRDLNVAYVYDGDVLTRMYITGFKSPRVSDDTVRMSPDEAEAVDEDAVGITQAELKEMMSEEVSGHELEIDLSSDRSDAGVQQTGPVDTDKSIDDTRDRVDVQRQFASSVDDTDVASIAVRQWVTQSLDRTGITAEHYTVLQSADLVSEETFGSIPHAEFISQTYDASIVTFMNDVFDLISALDGGEEKVRAIMHSIDHIVLSNSGWFNAKGSGHGYYDDTVAGEPFRAVVLGIGSQAFTDSDWEFTELDTIIMAALLIHEVRHVENAIEGITDPKVGEELALFEGNIWYAKLCDAHGIPHSSSLPSLIETEHFADNEYDNQFVKAHMYFSHYPDAQVYVHNVIRTQAFAQSAAAMGVYGHVDRDTIENIGYQLEGTPETGLRQHSRIVDISRYDISNIPEIARTGEVWEFDFNVYDEKSQVKTITSFATVQSEVVEIKNSDTGELMMGNRYFGGAFMPDGSVRTFWINVMPNNRYSIEEIKNDSIAMSSAGMLGMMAGLFSMLPGESVSARRREELPEAFPRRLLGEVSRGMAETVAKAKNILDAQTDIRLVVDTDRLDELERHEVETYARHHDTIQVIDVRDFSEAQKTFTQETIVLMIGVKENERPQIEDASHARIFVGENIDVRTVIFASFALIVAALLVEAKERTMNGVVPIDGPLGIFKDMDTFVAQNETLIKAIRAEMTMRIVRTAA